MHFTGISEVEERKKNCAEEIFEVKMAENCPNLTKDSSYVPK